MRHNYPYLIGVYLAINAIPDVCLIVDGPDCYFFKAGFIFGNHDMNSTLMNPSGFSRIVYTNTTINNIIMDRTSAISGIVDQVEKHGGFSALFLVPSGMVSLTDFNYRPILDGHNRSSRRPLHLIEGKSLSTDWMGGYAEILTVLAEKLPLSAGSNRKNKVGIVGNLMNRLEADETANIGELKRMLAAIDLELVSTWLDGSPYSSLANISDAETIISLPCGRRAARIVAERTKAHLIEADVPFGFAATEHFIKSVSSHYDRERQGKEFIESELAKYIPNLERLVQGFFLHKKAFYIGPPHLLDGFLDIAETVGIRVAGIRLSSTEGFRDENVLNHHHTDIDIVCQTDLEDMKKTRNTLKELKVDFAVTDSGMFMARDFPVVEFGFPSFFSHCFYPKPYMGISGMAYFLERISRCLYSVLRRNEISLMDESGIYMPGDEPGA